MKWVLIPAALAVLVFAVDRLLLWMEWRGWIDYRRTDPGRIDSGRIGPALLGIQSLFDPGARHHLEERNAVRTERDARGGGGAGGDDAGPS
ncbi:MAG: hypothetical protein ACM3SU_18690 [Acidobacteriota bacterium]